jgi:hypothetical protein
MQRVVVLRWKGKDQNSFMKTISLKKDCSDPFECDAFDDKVEALAIHHGFVEWRKEFRLTPYSQAQAGHFEQA